MCAQFGIGALVTLAGEPGRVYRIASAPFPFDGATRYYIKPVNSTGRSRATVKTTVAKETELLPIKEK